MTSYKTDLAGLPRLLQKKAVENREAALKAARRTIKVDAPRQIQLQIQRANPIPVDTGNYAGSWVTEDLPDGAQIYSGASPAIKEAVIESGRRPAFIPIRPLADWVRRKLGEQDPKRARSIAFAISKKASQKARPAQQILAKANPEIVKAFKRNLKRAFGRGGE